MTCPPHVYRPRYFPVSGSSEFFCENCGQPKPEYPEYDDDEPEQQQAVSGDGVERAQSSIEEMDYIAGHENTPLVVAQAALRAKEVIAALTASGVGMWQPIETAPKGEHPKTSNGPPILIWREGWPTGYEGCWYAHDQAWYFANEDSEYGSAEYPTHWMPLPEPPRTALQDNDGGMEGG